LLAPICLVVCLLDAVAVHGADIRPVVTEAVKAYKAKDFVRARALYEQACTSGDAESCYWAGDMLRTGQGGPQDQAGARARYEQACIGGSIGSCFNAGLMFDRGLGGQKDPVRARALYEQACTRGDVDGCASLGDKFYAGEGVAKDHSRARELYGKACAGSHATGCFTLGYMQERGEGGAKDGAGARESYAQACKGGYGRGCRNLGIMLRVGDGGPQDLARAQKVYAQACKGGDATGCSLESVSTGSTTRQHLLKDYEERARGTLAKAPCPHAEHIVMFSSSDQAVLTRSTVKVGVGALIGVAGTGQSRGIGHSIDVPWERGFLALARTYPGVDFSMQVLQVQDLPKALRLNLVDVAAVSCDAIMSTPALFGAFQGLNMWVLRSDGSLRPTTLSGYSKRKN
jgi:TPR repeat protein